MLTCMIGIGDMHPDATIHAAVGVIPQRTHDNRFPSRRIPCHSFSWG
jgi:hypothetical protein